MNKGKAQSFRIVVIPTNEGGYTVEVPLLPGCVSFGTTLEETTANAKQAIRLHIEDLAAHGELIPEEDEDGCPPFFP